MKVCEAVDGQQIKRGHAYIAPGDKHLLLKKDGSHYYCQLDDSEPINRHKPSVDVMFRSVSKAAGNSAIGVLLTGMGKDGAEELKLMRDKGAITIAQDKESSIVHGMPGAAIKLGGATYVLPIDQIAPALISLVNKARRTDDPGDIMNNQESDLISYARN